MINLKRLLARNIRVVAASYLVVILLSPYRNVSAGDGKIQEVKEVSVVVQNVVYLTNTSECVKELEQEQPTVEEKVLVSRDYEMLGSRLSDLGTSEELDLLYRVVKAEVTCDDFEAKCNVASVMLNRLKDKGSLSEVLVEDQFSSIRDGRVLEMENLEIDKQAVEYVLQNGDTTSNAYFFDSTRGNSWASTCKEYIFTDSVGHAFYEK